MENYSELGLTNSEGKVYETLVEHGKLGAGEISGRSGVSYSKIYNVLDSLINKGLVRVIPEKSKRFVPGDPEALLKLIDEKEKRLIEAREKAMKMKEFYERKEKNPVTMLFGRKGFYKIVSELEECEKYEYSIKWTAEYKEDMVGKSLDKIKRGKDLKVLTRYDKETEQNVNKWLKVHKNFRKFSNEGVAMDIRDDKEVMIGLIKNNVTLLIKDRAFAKIMKQLFLESYNNGEKIK